MKNVSGLGRRELLMVLASLSCISACAGSPSLPAASVRAPGRTEVVVLGTLHRAHLQSRGYSLEVIERTLRRIQPDVVLTEIPPDRYPSALEELGTETSGERIRDDWVRAFPEIWGVLVPLRRELGYQLVPVSGWTPRVSRDRKAYYARHPQGPASRRYRSARRAFEAAARRHRQAENPRWVNGAEYLELTTRQENALADAADSLLGKAAVRAINEAHWQHIEAAIRAHRSKRILLVYGARHRWYTQPRIEALPDVTLLPVDDFLR